MKKILLNNQIRVFQIITSTNEQFFCNLHHIPSIIKENNLRDGYYKVYHFWRCWRWKIWRRVRGVLEGMVVRVNIKIWKKMKYQ